MPNSTFETIKDIVTIVTPAFIAYIAYKQAIISNRQKVIHTQIDGMKSELVDAVAGRNVAEGQLKGMEQAKQEAIVAIKVAPAPKVQEVKIVEQSKPVDVKIDDQTKPVEVKIDDKEKPVEVKDVGEKDKEAK